MTDAGPAFDAGPAIDSGFALDSGGVSGDAAACGLIGATCDPSMPSTCPDGMLCVEGAGRGLCLPMGSDSCGGIIGAACPDTAPYCFMYGSASAWPCLAQAERDCVCATDEGSRTWSDEGEPCAP